MSDPDRQCGPCTACCTVMGVPELEKGLHQECEHLGPTGCRIYAHRPASCRTFACQWLRGLLELDGSIDPALRPDRCGVIFDYQPDTPFGDVYTAWELEPGASERDPASDIVKGLAEHFLVVVTAPSTHGEPGSAPQRFLGPAGLVARATDLQSRVGAR